MANLAHSYGTASAAALSAATRPGVRGADAAKPAAASNAGRYTFCTFTKPVQHLSYEETARAIARLSHPNVVTLYRTGEHQGRPFLVSEYVAGASLAEVVKALNALGANPMDLLAILQAMKAAGALRAELEVI